MNDKCCCNSYTNNDGLKAMSSIDYDSLIERLEEARDEINAVIKILCDRKDKDNMINSILSSNYEEEDEKEDEEKKESKDTDIDELLKIFRDIQKQRTPYKYYTDISPYIIPNTPYDWIRF